MVVAVVVVAVGPAVRTRRETSSLGGCCRGLMPSHAANSPCLSSEKWTHLLCVRAFGFVWLDSRLPLVNLSRPAL